MCLAGLRIERGRWGEEALVWRAWVGVWEMISRSREVEKSRSREVEKSRSREVEKSRRRFGRCRTGE
jgi:hypothetical protein